MKTKTNIDERILALAEPIADDLGLRLVRIRVMAGKRRTVQIMAERKSDGQMSVENCADLSRELSALMEVEDPIADAYMLEVSSPGLDRPLTDLESFETYEGYLVRLELDRLCLLYTFSEPTRRTPISYAVFCLKKISSLTLGLQLFLLEKPICAGHFQQRYMNKKMTYNDV